MRVLSLVTVLLAVLAAGGCAAAPWPVTDGPRHVVLIAAEPEYDSAASLRSLAEQLRSELGPELTVDVLTAQPDPGTPDNIPGLEKLAEADCLVIYARFLQVPPEQLRHIDGYLRRGGAVVGLRTSTHAFAYPAASPLASWNSFGPRVLGAPWVHHYGQESSTDVTLAPGAGSHPILSGVAAYRSRSWLYALNPKDTPVLGRFPPPEAEVLLLGTAVIPNQPAGTEPPREPVAWARRTEHGGRVFTTTLGHPDDFQNPAFRRVMVNAVRWALEPDRPVK